MYQYDKHFDLHALGREIKRKREQRLDAGIPDPDCGSHPSFHHVY